jgi:putative endonuclease
LVRAVESFFRMQHLVYTLISLHHDHRYIGLTQDSVMRIKKHNAGQVRSTAPYIPFAMVLLRQCADRLSARKAEKYFKSGFGRKHLDRLLKRELKGIELSSGQIIDLSKCENAE